VELKWHGALAMEEVKWRRSSVVERVAKVEIPFYSSEGWESDGPGRMAGDDSADSILHFRLERESDEMKH
jgi:hypothetical protein